MDIMLPKYTKLGRPRPRKDSLPNGPPLPVILGTPPAGPIPHHCTRKDTGTQERPPTLGTVRVGGVREKEGQRPLMTGPSQGRSRTETSSPQNSWAMRELVAWRVVMRPGTKLGPSA